MVSLRQIRFTSVQFLLLAACAARSSEVTPASDSDADKRARLRRLGLRVVVIRGESLEADLASLRERLVV
jgi:hypothetical protein